MTTWPRSLANTSVHLAVLAALASIIALMNRTSPAPPEPAFKAEHVAGCRICAACPPEEVAARDEFLLRNGCIDDPRHPE